MQVAQNLAMQVNLIYFNIEQEDILSQLQIKEMDGIMQG